ncbi:Uncharacterised protein [Vibrio cholerae]|nr:Uncharacterised protein [Vibrio cholerae]
MATALTIFILTLAISAPCSRIRAIYPTPPSSTSKE